jgi:N-methylhydantoinase B/oxoprolinase/acetone carboxylase alpha subunit
MEQISAVEWLNSEVERLTTRAGIYMSWEMMDSIIRQAKQMEKEQIENAYNNGDNRSAELYYNETFKSE